MATNLPVVWHMKLGEVHYIPICIKWFGVKTPFKGIGISVNILYTSTHWRIEPAIRVDRHLHVAATWGKVAR